MTDLFCPATLLVARHGDADYVETGFSDEGGWLTEQGRAQAEALAERVAHRGVARVWSSDTSRAAQTAEILATRLGVGVVTRKTLREAHIGDLLGQPFSTEALRAVVHRWFEGDLTAAFPGGESGRAVVERYASELNDIADQHRGETVLVVAHQNAAGISLPVLAGNVSPSYVEHHLLANGDFAEVEVDSDGWRLLRWPGPVPSPGSSAP